MPLTEAQQAAVAHTGGPLLVLGAAGTGKTHLLAARAAARLDAGVAPEQLLVLAHDEPAATALREAVERRAGVGRTEDATIASLAGLCTGLLRDDATEAGVDPFATPVSGADRLALLLEHLDDLPLLHHDLRGNPSALIGSIVGRIDRLKAELVTPEDYAAWAGTLAADDDAGRARAAREREFAALYAAHERLLAEAGALDTGDLVLGVFRLLRSAPHVRARLSARFRHVLVDDFQDASFSAWLLLRALRPTAGTPWGLCACADDDVTIERFRNAAVKNVEVLRAEAADLTTVRLDRGFRAGATLQIAAGAVVAPLPDRIAKPAEPADHPGTVAFWACESERAQAQAVAGDVERLLSRTDVAPEDVCVLVRSVFNEGQAVAVALEERAVPYRLTGAAAFFQRAEVRDLLAWLRLLVDPGDAGAVVRALARAPIELRAIDLARVTQIARRRKVDMIGALAAALESPQVPPEARERVVTFLKLYRSASQALDSARPDLFTHRLIERLGLRRQLLFAATAEVADRLVNLARFGELAADYARRAPQATARDFAHSIAAVAEAGVRQEEAQGAERARGVQVMAMHAAKGLEFGHVYVLGLFAARMPGPRRRSLEPIPDALLKESLPADTKAAHVAGQRRLLHVAMTRARQRLVLAYPERTERGAAQHASPFAEEALAAVGGTWEHKQEELFGPAETLQSTFRVLRDELLQTVAEVGSRLGELRFDTDLDVSHAVVRHLEVLKLSALMERTRAGQTVAEALPEVNARLLQSATSEQREIFETSALDEYLLDAERDERTRARAVARRTEPSLESFIPRKGDGLVLSASDIETYRTCPLKYKFARVFRIPQEPTLNQRFGIVVHQVLERFHAGETPHQSLPELLGLLEAGWRRSGFGASEPEKQLREKAEAALVRYHERWTGEDAEPVWFERSFAFTIGAHTLRGRVDRVDRLPDGAHELIDYKTGRPKRPADLVDDVQLALYAVASSRAWGLPAAHQAYYYVLDDTKVAVDRTDEDREWIEDTVLTVADGIQGQGFEPTPSWSACSICDYRIACPAAER